jgi:hypothetical protein
VPVLLLLVPILDTTLVTAVRILSGRRPSQGGRDHSSHRLVAIGLSQRGAVSILWLLSAAGGASAIVVQRFDSSWGAILTIGLLLGTILFAVFLARIRVYDDEDFKRLHEGNVTPLVADFMHKRRVAEVLLDLCLITLAYYTAYHLRFDSSQFGANYPLFMQSLPIVVAVPKGGALRPLSRCVASLRDDGRGGVCEGGRARHGRDAGRHSLRLPVRELLPGGVCDLRGPAAPDALGIAGVVSSHQRIRAAAPGRRSALRRLWDRQCESRDDS